MIGCLNYKMGKIIDITGQKFNHLTVLGRADDYVDPKGKHRVRWLCECDCSNKTKIITDSYSLRNGHTKSCGCSQRIMDDMVGRIFGRWKVLEYAGIKNRNVMWKCECQCENHTIGIVKGSRLRSGLSNSCGCLQKEITTFNNKDRIKLNEYNLDGTFGIGYTNNKDSYDRNYFYFDLEDYDKIKKYTWYFNDSDYLVCHERDNDIQYRMHRLIVNPPKDMVVDHIHGNNTKNDNRKSNLRIATNQQNTFNHHLSIANKSGETGIQWNNKMNKWTSSIMINGINRYLGSFENFEDAISVRKEAEKKYFGEFAYDYSQAL